MLRSLDQLPAQGDRPPWRLRQNYPLDLLTLRFGRLKDRGVRFVRQPRTKSGSRRSMMSSDRMSPSSSPVVRAGSASSDTPASARA